MTDTPRLCAMCKRKPEEAEIGTFLGLLQRYTEGIRDSHLAKSILARGPEFVSKHFSVVDPHGLRRASAAAITMHANVKGQPSLPEGGAAEAGSGKKNALEDLLVATGRQGKEAFRRDEVLRWCQMWHVRHLSKHCRACTANERVRCMWRPFSHRVGLLPRGRRPAPREPFLDETSRRVFRPVFLRTVPA